MSSGRAAAHRRVCLSFCLWWQVLCELDQMWLPIHKSWRLNERMYGALTGLSKKKTRSQCAAPSSDSPRPTPPDLARTSL